MKNSFFGALLLALVVMVSQSVLAQERVFDPRLACVKILPTQESFDKILVGLWASGFIAAFSDKVTPVGESANDQMVESLNMACAKAPGASFVSLVRDMAAAGLKPSQNPMQGQNQEQGQNPMQEPGSPAQGRQILKSFLVPGADLVALTAALKPTPKDISAIYGEPLASSLIAAYEKAFALGAAIKPGEGRDTLLATFTTTFELKNGAGALSKFPGGYKDVLEYFIADAPIASFKFVRQGESTGTFIAGFTYVNGRWVLMPKPWRGL